MEITNICPYCGGEMREGALPAYKYALRWCPSDERGGIEEEKSVRLNSKASMRPRSTARAAAW